MDTHVLNNLAVCLAHQQRFDEALVVMLLQTINPEDLRRSAPRQDLRCDGQGPKAPPVSGTRLKTFPPDTLHHIEFRQIIRLDPVFTGLKGDRRFEQILRDAYGEEAEYVLSGGQTSRGPRGKLGCRQHARMGGKPGAFRST